MIKLIASDLDGTLLQDGTQELTPRAIRANLFSAERSEMTLLTGSSGK